MVGGGGMVLAAYFWGATARLPCRAPCGCGCPRGMWPSATVRQQPAPGDRKLPRLWMAVPTSTPPPCAPAYFRPAIPLPTMRGARPCCRSFTLCCQPLPAGALCCVPDKSLRGQSGWHLTNCACLHPCAAFCLKFWMAAQHSRCPPSTGFLATISQCAGA